MLTMKRISLLLALFAILALLVAFRPGPALADTPLGITPTATEPGITETPFTPTPSETPGTPTAVSPTETARVPTATPTIEVLPPGDTPTPTEPPERPERPRPTSEAVVLPQTGDLPPDGGTPGSGVMTALFIALIGAMLLGFTMGDRIRRWFASLGIFGTVVVLGLLAYALLQMAVQTSIAASLQTPAAVSLPAGSDESLANSPAEVNAAAAPAALLGVVAAQPLTGAAVMVRKEDILGTKPSLKSRDLTAVQRVVIPALSVDAEVKLAPLEDGAWNIKGLRDRVAWLAKTSAPGEGGNTVLAGHIRVRYLGDGPFRYLDRLEPGQEVVIYTLEKMYTYRVREQLVVGIEDVHVTTEAGQPQITLLTCTDWDEEAENYRNRRAVIADLVSVATLLDSRIQ